MNVKRVFESLLIILAFGVAVRVEASVVIDATRVIYNQNESEVTLKLTNAGEKPALLQVWIDKGDPKAAPSSINVPFTITPPVSRIDPAKSQTLRIIYTGEALPADHESVFWLNVLEIPSKATGEEASANSLQIAFRSRIKLFYRPAGLKGDANGAPALVGWHVVTQDGHTALEASNHSAFNVSFIEVKVTDGVNTASLADGVMVGPGETATMPLKGNVSGAPAAKVHFRTLNDLGGSVEGEAPLK
ncbi:chaperone protein EcpD [Paraburkholderia fungorum]|uniref:Chaperone protein EcpD n=2 Tax=Paraburkholderia fungorum TaxID=134537 RepID=A0A1H1IZR7_9BURK|nr:fimbria/pilus periplasmic chaperone [Paraburkholderia fungorum]SDR43192.1 chaperone protein EcpD [Paraburkholderia fungorum]